MRRAFFIIPGIALLNMATYKDHLGIDAFLASTQGAFLALAIGVGGVVVGKRSRGRLRPRFEPRPGVPKPQMR